MTDQEWAAIRLLLTQTFVSTAENRYDNNHDIAYRMSLGDQEPAAILTAIRVLHRSGQRYVPAVADILDHVNSTPDATFDEMVGHVFLRRDAVLKAQPQPRGLWRERERARARDDVQLARAAALPPAIGSFVVALGLRRLREVDLENTWDRKELREAWAAHLEAMEGREIAVLASGRGPGGLRQLDPLAALSSPVRQLDSPKEAA